MAPEGDPCSQSRRGLLPGCWCSSWRGGGDGYGTTVVASKATKKAEKISKAPCKVMDTAGKVAKIVEIGYGTIVAMDLATSKIHGPPNKASDGHSGNVGRAAALPARKGRL